MIVYTLVVTPIDSKEISVETFTNTLDLYNALSEYFSDNEPDIDHKMAKTTVNEMINDLMFFEKAVRHLPETKYQINKFNLGE